MREGLTVTTTKIDYGFSFTTVFGKIDAKFLFYIAPKYIKNFVVIVIANFIPVQFLVHAPIGLLVGCAWCRQCEFFP